jgi:hypothetical protein
MQADRYELHDLQEIKGKISSTVLTGFELELTNIFGAAPDEDEEVLQQDPAV